MLKKPTLLDYTVFAALALIWGSSFILIKGGISALTSVQAASLRISIAGLIALPFAVKYIKFYKGKQLLYMFVAGISGNLIPAFLFAIAEKNIASALAGMLNSLTPIFTILLGIFFFNLKPTKNNLLGIGVSFIGCLLLFFIQKSTDSSSMLSVFLVTLATAFYGFNVNFVHKYLGKFPPLQIAAITLCGAGTLATVILLASGFLKLDFHVKAVQDAIFSTALLGITSTAIATVLFYGLIKRTGPVFGSLITYAIPVVAIAWGYFFNEAISWQQIAALGIILLGIYIARKQ